MKLKWKVADVSTGRYRSFFRRGWPTATDVDTGRMAVALYADGEYSNARKETAEIRVCIADHRQDAGFIWRTLKVRPIGLTAAKGVAKAFLTAHPEFLASEAQ